MTGTLLDNAYDMTIVQLNKRSLILYVQKVENVQVNYEMQIVQKLLVDNELNIKNSLIFII